MTAYQFAKQCFQNEKFVNITIISLCGSYYLGDDNNNMFKGKAFPSKNAAMDERSKVIGKACKFIK